MRFTRLLTLGRPGEVYGVSISHNGALVAAVGDWGASPEDRLAPRVAVWSAPSGRLLWTAPLRYASRTVCFLVGDRYLVDDEVQVWDARTGRDIRRLDGVRDPERRFGTGIGATPDGRWLAVGGARTSAEYGQTVALFDTKTWTKRRVFTGFDWGDVVSVAFSDDGRRLAAATYADETGDAEVAEWNTRTGRRLFRVSSAAPAAPEIQPPVTFIPDTHKLITGAIDGAGLLESKANAVHWQPLFPRWHSSATVLPLLIHGRSPQFLIGQLDLDRVVLWPIASVRSIFQWHNPPEQEPGIVPLPVSSSADGSVIAIARSGGEIGLWRVVWPTLKRDTYIHSSNHKEP